MIFLNPKNIVGKIKIYFRLFDIRELGSCLPILSLGMVTCLLLSGCGNGRQGIANNEAELTTARVAILELVKGNNDEFYNKSFAAILDLKNTNVLHEALIDNVRDAQKWRYLPSTGYQTYVGVRDLYLSYSINRAYGFPLSYWLELQLRLDEESKEKWNPIDRVEFTNFAGLNIQLQSIAPTLAQKSNRIASFRSKDSISQLKAGPYQIKIVTNTGPSKVFNFILDPAPEEKNLPSWDQLKSQKIGLGKYRLQWPNFISANFNKESDRYWVYTKIGEQRAPGEKPPIWDFTQERGGRQAVITPVIPDGHYDWGVSFIEQRGWGQLSVVQSVNYRRPLISH